jgi:hypothetical protein
MSIFMASPTFKGDPFVIEGLIEDSWIFLDDYGIYQTLG